MGRHGVDGSTLRQWIANYEAMGLSGIVATHTNSKYSVELKTAAIEAYLQGEGSLLEICKKYRIRSTRQLRNWIMVIKNFVPPEAKGDGSI